MRDEYIRQYGHIWRAFEKIVSDFDDSAWIHVGFGVTRPARIACHVLQSTRFYINDTAALVDGAGHPFDMVCSEAPEEDLPSRDAILSVTPVVKARTEAWLRALELAGDNPNYAWTGATMESVVLFLLRHSTFHLGELNALLNEQLGGKAADHFATTLGDPA